MKRSGKRTAQSFEKKKFEFGEGSENKGSMYVGLPCPKCNKGELEWGNFDCEGRYYKVFCKNEDCNAKFWESPRSVEAWGEIV